MNFKKFCEGVWTYLELEFLVCEPRRIIKRSDIRYFYKDGHDVQSTAFLIKEIIPKKFIEKNH